MQWLYSPSKHPVEFNWINKGGSKIGPFNPYVICPCPSMIKASSQTLIRIIHDPNKDWKALSQNKKITGMLIL